MLSNVVLSRGHVGVDLLGVQPQLVQLSLVQAELLQGGLVHRPEVGAAAIHLLQTLRKKVLQAKILFPLEARD